MPWNIYIMPMCKNRNYLQKEKFVLTQEINDESTILNLFFCHEWVRKMNIKFRLFFNCCISSFKQRIVQCVGSTASSFCCFSSSLSLCFTSSLSLCFTSSLIQPSFPLSSKSRQVIVQFLNTIRERIVLLVIQLVVNRSAKRPVALNPFVLLLDVRRSHIRNVMLGIELLVSRCFGINWLPFVEVSNKVPIQGCKSVAKCWQNKDANKTENHN